MQRHRALSIAVILAFSAGGCGSGPAQHLMSIEEATTGDCPTGGIAISQGSDDNGNEVLDSEKVDQRQPICDGIDGLAGSKGADGKDGAPGTTNRVLAVHHCYAYIGTIGVDVTYDNVLLSSGDVFVGARVADAYISSQAALLYAAASNGAASGTITVTFDYYGSGTAGFWTLAFNAPTQLLTVSYTDFEMGGSGVWTLVLPASSCSVNVY